MISGINSGYARNDGNCKVTSEVFDRAVEGLVQSIYDQPLVNNAHLGDLVEFYVAELLKESSVDWRHVALGYCPWDFEAVLDGRLHRVQVKTTSIRQAWPQTEPIPDKRSVRLRYRPLPTYFLEFDSVGHYAPWREQIESDRGFHCEWILCVHHGITDQTADHRNLSQWRFTLIPTAEWYQLKQPSLTKPRVSTSMALKLAIARWGEVGADNLSQVLDERLTVHSRQGKSRC